MKKAIEKKSIEKKANEKKKCNVMDEVVVKKSVGKCCACAMTGTCRRCSCAVKHVACTCCVPMKYNRCLNVAKKDVGKAVESIVNGKETVVNDLVGKDREKVVGQDGVDRDRGEGDNGDQWWQDKFTVAFGGNLVCSNGDVIVEEWYVWWTQLVSCFGSLYDLPNGNVGKRFIDILANEIFLLAERKASSERFIVFCRVILQRDGGVRKSCDVRRLISRRLELWNDGKVNELVQEAIRCSKQGQRRMRNNGVNEDEQRLKRFTRLMWRGEIKAAARLINQKMKGDVMGPNDIVSGGSDKTVIEALQDKHPVGGNVMEDVLLDDELPSFVDIDVTGGHIERIARSLHGGAGPGGTTSSHWQSFLLCYGSHSARLRDAIAALARLMANNVIDWNLIRALMSCRLIALNKNPGVRPIGVGEVLRRLLGKAMVVTTGVDVEELCGADQLCSGLKGGIEGAIHSVSQIFDDKSTMGYGVLMVDAKNAFNSVNRIAGLWNARHLWPRCSRFLFNTYRGHSSLWVNGCPDPLYSREGVTQGDPLSMCFYAVSVLPLIRKLKSAERTQTWFADDSACVGSLESVKDWFLELKSEGPKYGYFPESSKSVLVVDESLKDKAESLFGDVGIKIVSGCRFLGGFVGGCDERDMYVKSKVNDWIKCIRELARIAKSQPQAAYAALVKSIQHEWDFLQRVVSVSPDSFDDLKRAISDDFWPSLFGNVVTTNEAKLFFLPTRMGGMGVRDPTLLAELSVKASRIGSSVVLNYLTGVESGFSVADHHDVFMRASNDRRVNQGAFDKECVNRVLRSFDDMTVRTIERSINGKISNWLNVVPVLRYGFVLSEREFRDAIALRYRRPLIELPALCDGCDAPTDVNHALSCRKGGLIIRRHNEVRDALGDVMAMGYNNVL